jgi:putative flippase GtrA
MASPDRGAPSAETGLRSQLPRFLAIGLSNLALSYGVFTLSMRLFARVELKALVSQLVTYTIGTTWSYYWNRRWTFTSKAPVAGEMTRFVILQIGCAAVSSGAVSAAVDVLHLEQNLAWFVVVGLVTVLNFALSRVWVFRKTPPLARRSSGEKDG